MLSEENRKQLIEKIRIIKKDLSDLNPKLKELNNLKEIEYRKKEEIKKQIKPLINNLKKIKVEKEKSIGSVKSFKEQRDQYNSEVRNLIKKVKDLNKQKQKAFEKSTVKTDPSRIQEQIEKIESRLETEVSFENEKKLMKEVKKLKKVYEESAEIKELLENISKISKDIYSSKTKADEFHNKLKEFSQEKKTGYDDFIALSKQINDLRRKEEEAFHKFIELKKQFVELNKQVNSKYDEIRLIQQHLNEDINSSKKEKEEKIKQTLMDKTKAVFEKLRNKKKLTTEDLLVFQHK